MQHIRAYNAPLSRAERLPETPAIFVRTTMRATRQLLSVFAAALVGSTLSAQAPASEVDAHVNAARTAAGLDYRATFVNLCFAGASGRRSARLSGALYVRMCCIMRTRL